MYYINGKGETEGVETMALEAWVYDLVCGFSYAESEPQILSLEKGMIYNAVS